MDSTCRKNECGHWNDGKCPFSIEVWWKPSEGNPKLVLDCAPIRTMIMVQELYNQTISLQKAQEQQRNESKKLMISFSAMVDHALKIQTEARRQERRISEKTPDIQS